MKKNALIVAGTRPEAIKMSPLYLELQKSDKINPIFVSTAQHRQMLDQALSMFDIKADFDMDVMQPGQTLSDLTTRMLSKWKGLFTKIRPDVVVVQGDTTTVLATSIAAFYERIPIAHVEAGLRTYNLHAPFPEEMNRRLTDPISRWCFAPTTKSLENLYKENIPRERCFVTGNTVVDALLHMSKKLELAEITEDIVAKNCGISDNFVRNYLIPNSQKKFILLTGHRRENFGEGFENICKSILKISEKYPDVGILYPVHLNPNVQEPVKRILGKTRNVELIKPVGYADFIWLMKKCHFVLSDSGGVQEEAPSLGKPVLVMRDTTERPEGVDAGVCKLVGTDLNRITEAVSELLENQEQYMRRSALKNPYGDGTASKKIRNILEREL